MRSQTLRPGLGFPSGFATVGCPHRAPSRRRRRESAESAVDVHISAIVAKGKLAAGI